MRRLITVFALLFSACAPEGYYGTLSPVAPPVDATPTQEIVPTLPTALCAGIPGTGFEIISEDPCLDTLPVARANGQFAPASWIVVNTLETADGLSGAEFYTAYAPILVEAEGYRFVVEGRAGRWGFAQDIELSEGCYIAKIAGYASVVEMAHAGQSNIGAHIFIGDYDLGFTPFPEGRGDFELFWPVRLEAGMYWFRAQVEARYATALPGTEVIVSMVALARDFDSDHCN